jgi:hypothetical protein
MPASTTVPLFVAAGILIALTMAVSRTGRRLSKCRAKAAPPA